MDHTDGSVLPDYPSSLMSRADQSSQYDQDRYLSQRPLFVWKWWTAVRNFFESRSRWHIIATSWLCWLAMCLALLGTPLNSNIGLTQIAESWGAIERVALWQSAFSWLIPQYALPPGLIAWTVRTAFVLLFISQAIVCIKVLRETNASFWTWFAGPLGAHFIMVLMPPTNADVFYYAMSADLAASGVNPYAHQLNQFPDNPLLPFNHWTDIGTVYGPLWTRTGKWLVSLSGNDPVAVILAYKVLMAAVAVALTLLVYRIAKALSSRQSTAVAVAMLVAWQPNMIFETSGQIHNDPFVMLFAIAALGLVIFGGTSAVRGGVVLTAMAFATKFIAIPLVGLTALVRLSDVRTKDERSWKPLFHKWILDITAFMAVCFSAFLPFWFGIGTVREMVSEPGRLFAHPIWRIGEAALQLLPSQAFVNVYRPTMRFGMQFLTLCMFAYATWHFCTVLVTRQSSGLIEATEDDFQLDRQGAAPWWSRALISAWVIVLVSLSMLPVNAHPWYWTWAIGPVALLMAIQVRGHEFNSTGIPRWIRWYLLAVAICTLAYHTRIARY